MRILWIPHIAWHIPQRAHLFCRALAACHQVHITDWVADFYQPGDYLTRRYVRNFMYREYRDGPIQVHGIPRVSPALYSRLLRRLNTHIFVQWVARIIARYDIEVVVGCFVLPPPAAARVVFDLFDENVAPWRYARRVPAYADEIQATEHRYLQVADAVVAASSVLADKVRAIGTRAPVHLIPNAVDLDQFNRADGGYMRTAWGVRGPIVGMVGNHDEGADLDRLLDAADALRATELTFVVAGRGAALPQAQKRARQRELSRVHFLGYIPPSRMPDVVAALDVGLCLYPRTEKDDARSSMRLIAYAAAGIPTVCTDLVQARRSEFPNVVFVQEDINSLVEGIQRALRLPRAQPPQIADYDLKRLAAQYEAVLRG